MAKKNNAGVYDDVLSDNSLNSDEDWAIRLGFFIHDAARLRRIVIDEAFRPLGVTRSQAWALAYLSRKDGKPQSELAEEMGLGKVALGGLVDRLEDAGMVERQPDATDRRIKRINITKKGRDVIKNMRNITIDANIEILNDISPEEVRHCVETLGKLNTNLERIKARLGA